MASSGTPVRLTLAFSHCRQHCLASRKAHRTRVDVPLMERECLAQDVRRLPRTRLSVGASDVIVEQWPELRVRTLFEDQARADRKSAGEGQGVSVVVNHGG